MACTVAQHHRTQPTTDCDNLTTRQQAQPEHTGKAGQTSNYPTPGPRNSRSTKPDTSHQGWSVDRGLELQASLSCGDGEALLDYDPAAGTSTVLLGPTVNGGGVVDAMVYPGYE